MEGSFFGLDVAMRGLSAEQIAMDVTNQNITNANTPGYSRQAANMQATLPNSIPAFNRTGGAGQLGTGVDITTIDRARDVFTDQQYRYETSIQGQSTTQQSALSQVESIFNEPSTTGINALLSNFWNSWQGLVNSPADLAARSNVRQQGQTLASTITSTRTQMVQLQSSLDQQVGVLTQQLNQLSSQVAGLNSEIAAVNATQQSPNDLRDQRDQLLDQMSKLVPISYQEMPNGMINVSLAGGGVLVQGNTAATLTTAPDANHPGFTTVVMPDGIDATLTGGQIAGTIASRDTAVGARITQLDQFASNLITTVNTVHEKGFGLAQANGTIPSNNAFFSGTNASDIAVSSQIIDPSNGTDPNGPQAGLNNIAAATQSGVPGDGSNALVLADLQNTAISQVVAGSGTASATLNDEYNSMIVQLGVDSRHAQDSTTAQGVLVQHLSDQRASTSSVSLDTEASNLIRYQRAFQAGARVITTIDDMLSTIINNLGLPSTGA